MAALAPLSRTKAKNPADFRQQDFRFGAREET